MPGQLAGHRLWKPTVRVLSDKCDNIVRAPANHRQRALHELHAIELAKAYAEAPIDEHIARFAEAEQQAILGVCYLKQGEVTSNSFDLKVN